MFCNVNKYLLQLGQISLANCGILTGWAWSLLSDALFCNWLTSFVSFWQSCNWVAQTLHKLCTFLLFFYLQVKVKVFGHPAVHHLQLSGNQQGIFKKVGEFWNQMEMPGKLSLYYSWTHKTNTSKKLCETWKIPSRIIHIHFIISNQQLWCQTVPGNKHLWCSFLCGENINQGCGSLSNWIL